MARYRVRGRRQEAGQMGLEGEGEGKGEGDRGEEGIWEVRDERTSLMW